MTKKKTPEVIDQLRHALELSSRRSVELTETVDPDIVGGLVLRIGGVVVDGSVRHRIDELREALRSASVDAATAAS
jgi:F0F1-type ATP synthase delta subunit